MLNTLKKFALQHFEPQKFTDTVVIAPNESRSFSRNGAMVIPFILNHKNHIYISEEGEFLIEQEGARLKDSVNIQIQLTGFAPELLGEGILEMCEFNLIPIDEDEIIYDLQEVISDFKSRVNLEIMYRECEIKELKKGYSFIRNLELYI